MAEILYCPVCGKELNEKNFESEHRGCADFIFLLMAKEYSEKFKPVSDASIIKKEKENDQN